MKLPFDSGLDGKLDWKNLAALFSQEAYQKRIAGVVGVGLMLLLTYQAALITWRILPSPETGVSSVVSAPAQARTTASQAPAKSWGIYNRHLFGIKQEKTNSVVQRHEKAPETTLKLVLRGIYSSDDPSNGAAIIAEPNGTENYYSVESQLPGGATLKEVYADRVILLRNGRFETLSLPKDNVDLGEVKNTATSSSLPSRPSISGGMASLRDYRDVLINEPQRLAAMVQIQPVNESGRFVGYKLNPGKDKGMFSCGWPAGG